MGQTYPLHMLVKSASPWAKLIRLITAKKERNGLQQPQIGTLPGKAHKRYDTIHLWGDARGMAVSQAVRCLLCTVTSRTG